MPEFKPVSKDYYDSVIKAMEAEGFKLFAWVTLNSHKHKNRVDPVRYCQDSRLFFHIPGKTMIVMLSLVLYFPHNHLVANNMHSFACAKEFK